MKSITLALAPIMNPITSPFITRCDIGHVIG